MGDLKMNKKDFVTSIVLIVFSITIIIMSYTMPRLERRGIDPFSAPGVVPGMIGGILFCLALIMFFRSIKNGGYLLFTPEKPIPRDRPHRGAVIRVLLTLALSLIYALGLLGNSNYSMSTGTYIFFFICLFEIDSQRSFWHQRKVFLFALLQAIVVSVAITLVFQNLFLVDLP
jgi:hypothetical protein